MLCNVKLWHLGVILQIILRLYLLIISDQLVYAELFSFSILSDQILRPKKLKKKCF